VRDENGSFAPDILSWGVRSIVQEHLSSFNPFVAQSIVLLYMVFTVPCGNRENEFGIDFVSWLSNMGIELEPEGL
jgi:hypothetical protein